MKLKILNKTFEVSYELIDYKKKYDDIGNSCYYQHYKITVEHNRKKIKYDYWTPAFELSKVGSLDKNNLIFAFYCLISDASYGMYDFCKFVKEAGYDAAGNCCKGYEAWKACKKQLGKVLSLGIKKEEIEEMINYMVNKYNI